LPALRKTPFLPTSASTTTATAGSGIVIGILCLALVSGAVPGPVAATKPVEL